MNEYEVYDIESCYKDLEKFLNDKFEEGLETISVLKIKHGYKIIFRKIK